MSRNAACQGVDLLTASLTNAKRRIFDQKVAFFEGAKADFMALKRELASNLESAVGLTSVSWRQRLSELAAVTKLTTDLITGLAGFSGTTKAAGTASNWLAMIHRGESLQSVFTQDAEQLALDHLEAFGADLNPYLRALEVSHTFFANLATSAEIQSSSEAARAEVARQLAALDVQISSIDARLQTIKGNFLADATLQTHANRFKGVCAAINAPPNSPR